MPTIRNLAVLAVLLLGLSGHGMAQTDQLLPSAIQKVEAIQARAYIDNSKIKPLMFESVMPMSHSSPRSLFGEIAAGRSVYLVDVQAALGYFDTLVAKAKAAGITLTVPALANLKKSVEGMTPPKQEDVIVSELGQGFYLVAIPLYKPKTVDELVVLAKDQIVRKGLVVRGYMVLTSIGTPQTVPPTTAPPVIGAVPEAPQYLIFFAEPPQAAPEPIPPGPYTGTRRFVPTSREIADAKVALEFLSSEKAKPLLYDVVPSAVRKQKPQEVFQAVLEGRDVYLMDLRFALTYYEVMATRVSTYWQNTSTPQTPPSIPVLKEAAEWGTKA